MNAMKTMTWLLGSIVLLLPLAGVFDAVVAMAATGGFALLFLFAVLAEGEAARLRAQAAPVLRGNDRPMR